jgi:hypothetical protein
MSILDSYKKLTQNKLFRLRTNIETHIPTPTEEEYKRGWITRYFIQRTNDKTSPIFEVNSNQFSKSISNDLYTAVSIRWRLTGPKETIYDSNGNLKEKSVSESNRIAIQLVYDRIPNLKLYLPNLLQFYK